jgi:hypothetical protein
MYVRIDYRFAKMPMSGHFTMNPLDRDRLLAVPDGVMLRASAGTGASARAKSVRRNRLASGTDAFYCSKWISHIGLQLTLATIVGHILDDVEWLISDGAETLHIRWW